LLATALSTAAGAFHFVPAGSLAVPSNSDVVHLGIFLFIGTAISAMAGALQRAVARERAQRQSLAAQDERLRLAVTATQDAIWDWDVVRGTLEFNHAVTALFGWTALPADTPPEWWQEQMEP
jgi:PAS domain-containing protein